MCPPRGQTEARLGTLLLPTVYRGHKAGFQPPECPPNQLHLVSPTSTGRGGRRQFQSGCILVRFHRPQAYRGHGGIIGHQRTAHSHGISPLGRLDAQPRHSQKDTNPPPHRKPVFWGALRGLSCAPRSGATAASAAEGGVHGGGTPLPQRFFGFGSGEEARLVLKLRAGGWLWSATWLESLK